MKEDKSKGNKFMFFGGIVMIVVSTILFLGNFTKDNTSPIIFAIIGIVFIGASKYRILK